MGGEEGDKGKSEYPRSDVSQVILNQNNQNIKVAYFGVVYSVPLHYVISLCCSY